MSSKRAMWSRLGAESLLIVLSVLLALFLNATWSSRQEAVETRRLLESVRAEIESNRAIVAGWIERHERIAIRVRDLRTRPPEVEPLVVAHQLRLDRVFGESLLDSMVRRTAWDTAQTSGLVRNFDLELAQSLTDVYGLQEIGPLRTLERITELVFERRSHQEEHLPETLVLLGMLFDELRGQERLLLESYDEALARLAPAD